MRRRGDSQKPGPRQVLTQRLEPSLMPAVHDTITSDDNGGMGSTEKSDEFYNFPQAEVAKELGCQPL